MVTSTDKQQQNMPHAVDAERAVLGALLMNNDLFVNSEGLLKDSFFYDKRHCLIHRVMVELYGQGYVDPVLLTRRLSESGELRDAGDREYIAEIADIGAAPVNMPAYIELVRNMALLRLMIQALVDSTTEAFYPEGKSPQQLLDAAEGRLSTVGETFAREYGGINQVGEIAKTYFDEIAEIVRTKNYDALLGVSSGFSKLDKMTAGLHAGDLVILAGRPGAGKTAFGLNILRHISAEEKSGVICFSLEMSAKQLTMRLLSQVGVDMQKMRVGRGINAEDLALLAKAASELEERDIYIDDSGTLNILEARTRARRIKREMVQRGVRLNLIVIDYLQLMESEPGYRSDTRAFEVSAISRGLKSLAKELNVPVLALSQLNRSIETRVKKRPMLSDLRESGAIEQDADLILFLSQEKDETGGADTTAQNEVELIIGKQRNGPVGSIQLRFDKSYSKFVQINKDEGYDHF